jgi:hypothetical protein
MNSRPQEQDFKKSSYDAHAGQEKKVKKSMTAK